MAYNFASSGFYKCLGDLPDTDGPAMRKATTQYVKNFNPQVWHDDPVRSLLYGEELAEGRNMKWTEDKKVGKTKVSTDTT